MRGHNRPPFPPKIPGTDLPSWDVPTAIIYRPARSAMTSRLGPTTGSSSSSRPGRRRSSR